MTAHKKEIPRAYLINFFRLAGRGAIWSSSLNLILTHRTSCSKWITELTTNRNNRSTPRDSVLPLTCLPVSAVAQFAIIVTGDLPCAGGA